MVRKAIMVLALAGAFATQAIAANWDIDGAHSSVNFSVSHLVISKTRGVFDDFNGTIAFDGKDVAGGSVTFTIQTASIDTDDEGRDEHLRNADFLDVETFPTMSFASKKVLPGKGKEFRLVGDLTIKGVSKEVTFDCEFAGVATDPWGNTKAGFTAETEIDRQDFDVSWSKSLDGGGLVVGDAVTIELELEANKVNETAQQ